MAFVAHPTLTALALAILLAAPAAAHGPQPNSLGMQFVRIPAGSFWMGNAETPEALARAYPQLEAKRFTLLGDEGPVHWVHISKAFELGRHEVTVGQFRRFVQASGYQPESERDGTGGYGYNPAYDPTTTLRGDAFEGRDPRYSWRNPGFAQGEDHPVVNVTWNDAQALAGFEDALQRRAPGDERIPGLVLPATALQFMPGIELSAAQVADARNGARFPGGPQEPVRLTFRGELVAVYGPAEEGNALRLLVKL